MPWEETTLMDQRKRFIGDLSSCLYTMSELCREYGISRKTGYKWAARWVQGGEEGLRERSRRPRRCPHRTDPRCVEALLEMRRSHPRWGARKLLAVLGPRHPDWPWPSPSTGAAVLKRHGLVTPRHRRRRREPPAKPRFEAQGPNEVWTADFKGEFRTRDGRLCYPLTVADRHSRFLLACRGRTTTAHDEARPVFEELFATYGVPRVILTDSGTPFAAPTSPRRRSRLSVWWIKLGIERVLIQPGHPEQNGRHERMHRTLKAETTRPPAQDLAGQQRAFDRFRREYNRERPHEALGQQTPSELYARSPRPYRPAPAQVSYPRHFEVRRVRRSGEIRWKGRALFVSQVLGGETVGLEEVDDNLWSLHFGPLLLGRYDQRSEKLDLL